jgi:hypothetical protein
LGIHKNNKFYDAEDDFDLQYESVGNVDSSILKKNKKIEILKLFITTLHLDNNYSGQVF